MPPFVSESARRHLWCSVRNTILSRRRTASWEDPDLEALLSDPLILTVMSRDGVCPEDVRGSFSGCAARKLSLGMWCRARQSGARRKKIYREESSFLAT